MKDSTNMRVYYESRMLLFKAKYLSGISTNNMMDKLKERIRKEHGESSFMMGRVQ